MINKPQPAIDQTMTHAIVDETALYPALSVCTVRANLTMKELRCGDRVKIINVCETAWPTQMDCNMETVILIRPMYV